MSIGTGGVVLAGQSRHSVLEDRNRMQIDSHPVEEFTSCSSSGHAPITPCVINFAV